MRIFYLALGLTLFYGAWSDVITVGPEDRQATQTEASDFTDIEQAKLVTAHNDLRRSLNASNMNYITWDGDLANNAKQLAKECKLAKKDVSIPVNLYKGPEKDARTVVDDWKKNAGDKCEKAENACLYQLQVPNSTKFGCGWKDCAGIDATKPEYVVVCWYDIKFRKDNNTVTPGNQCSKCGINQPKCYKGLCMSKELCDDAKFKDDCSCKVECEDFKLNKDQCKCEEIRVGNRNVHISGGKQKEDAKYLRIKYQDTTTDIPTTSDFPLFPTNGTGSEEGGDGMDGSSSESPEASRENSETHLMPAVNSILAGLLMWFVLESMFSK